MWEWVFWSGLITYFLLIVGSLFQFDFAVILVILFSGLGSWHRLHSASSRRCSRRTSTSSPASATSPARAARAPRRRSLKGVRRRGKKR